MANQLARRIGRRLARVVVLDASALIALVSSQDAHHNWALEMFRDTASFNLQMSCLTQAEVMVHPTRAGQLEKFQKMVNSIGLQITPIEPEDSASLANLRAKTSLKMPDVAVLRQAMKVNGTVATTDQKLAQAAKDLGFGVFHPKEFNKG
jgi:predicted nucleic acid-binding protein